ncbi:unnamed protein product [Closterium sp. NIES-64]|nr:unnamed protein product [Closterium sp. NIES-64]
MHTFHRNTQFSLSHMSALFLARSDKAVGFQVSAKGAALLDGLFTVLSFILSDGCKALPDYRMLVHAPTAAPPSAAAAAATSGAGTVTDGKTAGQGEEQQKQQQQQQWRFSLWCLNPAVAFRSVASACRTIVLTSGTLSPTESFASELGIDFTCTMEGMHVVDSTTQVWAGVIPRGPSGLSLNASYANACSPVFQDELAEALLPILAATPGGMLLFLPSFWLLDALCARWKATSAWHRLSSLKKIFCEPRGVEKLEGVLTRYRREVQQSATKPWTPLAVPQHSSGAAPGGARAEASAAAAETSDASEGIDFADDSARAVGVSENSQKHRNDLCCQNPKRLFLLDPCSAHSPRNPVTLPLLLSTATLPDTFAVSLPFSLFSSPSFPPLSSPAPFPPSTPPLSS